MSLEIAMVVIGWISYHCLVMVELQQSKQRIVWPVEYIRMRPFKTILSVTGAIMGYILCTELPDDINRAIELTAYAAAGYSPYHVFDAISAKNSIPDKNVETVKEILVKQDKFKASDPTTYAKAFVRKDDRS